MRYAILTAALTALAGCQTRGGDEAQVGGAADTVVTTETTQDTTIVTRDTTVRVDTVKKEGERPVGRDTVNR